MVSQGDISTGMRGEKLLPPIIVATKMMKAEAAEGKQKLGGWALYRSKDSTKTQYQHKIGQTNPRTALLVEDIPSNWVSGGIWCCQDGYHYPGASNQTGSPYYGVDYRHKSFANFGMLNGSVRSYRKGTKFADWYWTPPR